MSYGAGRALARGFLLAAAVTSNGCTHNYYYYGPPPVCEPTAVAPGAVTYGEVCEVPTQVVGGSTVAAGTPIRPAPVLGGPRPPRVVLSEPNGALRNAWRRPDSENGLATTRVEGAIDDPTITK